MTFPRRNSNSSRAGRAVALVGLVALGACGQIPLQKRLEQIHHRSALMPDVHRNPVIVIPGMLGTRLVDGDSGVVIWGAFGGRFANPEQEQGARLLALPMALDTPLQALRDRARVDGVLLTLDANTLGFPLIESPYASLLTALRTGGYRECDHSPSDADGHARPQPGDHVFFQFGYDWRRDNVENARLLHEFIVERRALLVEQIRQRDGVEPADVKFDIIAHSMGGLIARYFLLFGDADLPADGSVPEPTWAGAQYVDHVILVCPPNAGSIYPVYDLINGKVLSTLLPTYPPGILGTMPAMYQIMPRERHKPLHWSDSGRPVPGLYDVELWKEMKWGLADPGRDAVLASLLPGVKDRDERCRIAEDHLAKCLHRAEQFHAALDQPATPPDGLKLLLISGIAEPTHARAEVDRKTGSLHLNEKLPGDGTVTRASALLDERLDGDWSGPLRSPIAWQQVSFLFKNHYTITTDPTFTDSLLFQLLERPHYNDVTRASPAIDLAKP